MTSGQPPLVFHWPQGREVSIARPLFFLAALVVHASAFYLFQVRYPKSSPLRPEPIPVSLLAPVDSESRAILDWVSAQKPSFSIPVRAPLPPGLFETPLVPSYVNHAATPIQVAAVPPESRYPGIGELRFSGVGSAPPMQQPARRTWIAASRELQSRMPDPAPALDWNAHQESVSGPSSVFVGVDPGGKVAYAVVQLSSGSADLDQEALQKVTDIAFHPAPVMTWGTLTITWGNDALIGEPSPRKHVIDPKP